MNDHIHPMCVQATPMSTTMFIFNFSLVWQKLKTVNNQINQNE